MCKILTGDSNNNICRGVEGGGSTCEVCTDTLARYFFSLAIISNFLCSSHPTANIILNYVNRFSLYL